ncbi:MAG: GNAT family N-acyltransferase [Pseudomonadota bacterium]
MTGKPRDPRRDRKYRVRFAETQLDLNRAQVLRSLVFKQKLNLREAVGGPPDADDYDACARHVLIEDLRTGDLVCCCRINVLEDGSQILGSYSAGFYDLRKFQAYQGRMLELGRFCIAPEAKDPDVLRLAWGFLVDLVESENVELLFGCSSFKGIDTGDYEDAFALLKERYLAPRCWLPCVKAPSVFRFEMKLKRGTLNLRAAMQRMPPLLRTYLMMGGWVSDHAVIDRDLQTLHVFTGLETRLVSGNRRRQLSCQLD